MQILARGAVGDELPYFGPETAAEVEEGLLVIFEAREDGGVEGKGAQSQVDETE